MHDTPSATLLVCRQCGTAHAIEHNEPECKDRLFSFGKPMFDDDDKPRSWTDESGAMWLKWYPPFSDWPVGDDLATDKIAEMNCAYCGGNSLTYCWEKSWPCPSCGSEM